MTDQPMIDVKGRCPACLGEHLFIGDGGYLTCSNVDCVRPDAAHELIGEVADARRHGALTFCPQLVGHASMREFAIKISQKQSAYADAVKAIKARDDMAALAAEVLDAFEKYWAHASYDGPGDHNVGPSEFQAWRARTTEASQ
ncbi:hypothetical protein ACWD4O_38980 [Streptomyces sp. NPDC002623]